ncbi:MAG TPA: adenosine deaminase [Candidatus Limnocylindria bacterium]
MTGPAVAAPAVGLNLHSHLEGSVRPATAAQLAEELGIPSPSEGWEAALRMREPGTLTEFLVHVAHAYPLFRSPGAVYRLVREAVEDSMLDGQAFLELRFGPATHAGPSMPLHAVVDAASTGLRDASRETGMPAGLIVCALRHHDPDTNREVARAAAAFAGRGVVGFDVAGDELLFPSLEPMRESFAIASAAGLGLTAHAAEAGPASAVRDAVELLGVARIGHGSRVADDPELLRWTADAGICIEVCPTSNVLTGATPSHERHPVRAFLDAGCRVVVGDDDPTTTGSRLAAEITALNDRVGLDASQVMAIQATSLEVAFADASTRAAIRERLLANAAGAREA